MTPAGAETTADSVLEQNADPWPPSGADRACGTYLRIGWHLSFFQKTKKIQYCLIWTCLLHPPASQALLWSHEAPNLFCHASCFNPFRLKATHLSHINRSSGSAFKRITSTFRQHLTCLDSPAWPALYLAGTCVKPESADGGRHSERPKCSSGRC